MSWSAYVDESEPDPRADPGAYLLAAAVLPVEQLQAARDAVSALRLRGQRKLHCELDDARVGNIWLESREAKQNGRDLQLLAALRAENAISPRIRMDHPPGPREPLLWIPDLVAGAVGAARQGHPGYRDQLAGLLTVHEA